MITNTISRRARNYWWTAR